MVHVIALACALWSWALPPQQSSLVGVWRISYQAGLRLENGTATPIMATGTLTVRAEGDSLTGDLTTDPSPGLLPRKPVRLAARAGVGETVFVSRTQATLNVNGVRREATAVSTWRLRARGDTLSGTVERRLEDFDVPPQAPGPVTGTRRRP
jgi:hypothetical protein